MVCERAVHTVYWNIEIIGFEASGSTREDTEPAPMKRADDKTSTFFFFFILASTVLLLTLKYSIFPLKKEIDLV